MSASLIITPDRATYIRNHAWMAAIGMGGAMAVLWIMDNPHVWTGAVAGLAAIALRGWYLSHPISQSPAENAPQHNIKPQYSGCSIQ